MAMLRDYLGRHLGGMSYRMQTLVIATSVAGLTGAGVAALGMLSVHLNRGQMRGRA